MIRPEHIASNLRVEDSFTNGDVVEITITSDEGQYRRCRFLVHVDTDWGNLTMSNYSRINRLRRFISSFKPKFDSRNSIETRTLVREEFQHPWMP
jgi:hypothetical protein